MTMTMITDEMVEEGCAARHSPQAWGRAKKDHKMTVWVQSHRHEMHKILEAALSALPDAGEGADGAKFDEITEQDRECAVNILDDVVAAKAHIDAPASIGVDIVSQWIRKIRHQAIIADRKRRGEPAPDRNAVIEECALAAKATANEPVEVAEIPGLIEANTAARMRSLIVEAIRALKSPATTFVEGYFTDRVNAGDRVNPNTGEVENPGTERKVMPNQSQPREQGASGAHNTAPHPHPSANADAGGAIELPIKKPPGMYVLVPTEPTPKMLDAYDRARQATTMTANGVETYNPHQSYWALLNAAPETPSVPDNLKLETRPVAFLVPVWKGGRPLLFTDEGSAQSAAEYQRTKYRGLYVRDGSPLIANVPQLPDGWVMVPREPTMSMLGGALGSDGTNLLVQQRNGWLKTVEEIYKAMLAAAPKLGDTP